jgi:Ca2+-binding EF-hand superfamily protein
MVRDTGEPLLPRRLLKKYDKNRDLHLDAAELGWSAEQLAGCDVDGNRKLDAAELARLGDTKPDLELTVDLRSKEAEGGVLAVPLTSGKRLDDAGRLDYAKVAFQGAVVTCSLRNLDPIATAIDSAMQQFNLLDTDANGYLDKDETALRIRFERGLFDLIDADGDGKLFGEEMKQYVRARGEPAATTCRMNVYDTGNGFFMALDGNADGRVSMGEMRQAAAALAQLDRDGSPGISQSEPVRHFHIEFVRGSYQLFGPSEQLVAQTPAFQQRRPSGPIWFQRMDRNNDGDLTWNEFFGPREVFHKLDADADSLIDPQEAAKAQ